MRRQKIILDTDIGDDIDDALALALICASPEVELIGVTTVLGNVLARARQARTILRIAGPSFRDIPVAAGCGSPGASAPNQDSTSLPESDLPRIDPRHGVELVVDTIRQGRGDIIPVTIGAMTNLAAAIHKDRSLVSGIPKLLSMAGEFAHDMTEWNVRCDPQAAHAIFSSGIPIDLIPWSIGNTVRFAQSDVDRLAACGRPLGSYLVRALRAWQSDPSSARKHGMPHLYDPMTIATLIKPTLVTWKTGTVRVDETTGRTAFHEDAHGRHRVAFDAHRDTCVEFFLRRVLAV